MNELTKHRRIRQLVIMVKQKGKEPNRAGFKFCDKIVDISGAGINKVYDPKSMLEPYKMDGYDMCSRRNPWFGWTSMSFLGAGRKLDGELVMGHMIGK